MTKQKETEEMEKRMEILRVDAWAMDLLAGELIEEKTVIMQEIAPKVAAIQNIEHKLLDLTNRKTGLLVQYQMGRKVIDGLVEDSAEGMEVV